jgi:thioredoxin 1
MSSAAEVTGANWDAEVMKSEQPVLVDFWAPWCGPCKAIAPTIDQLAGELEGRLKVVKLNTDAAGDVASKYGIMSIPTLLLFKNGQVVEQMMGALPKSAIQSKIEPHLA